ncbi:DUF1190 domain-containing protein [Phreatobacter sp.]|uniref:DUF1190 domain-containing protein n=1 Tax=Phreatobacter sp. TaxID=1966341 RepID=UPI003F6FDB88
MAAAVLAAAALMVQVWRSGGECGAAPVWHSVEACAAAGHAAGRCQSMWNEAQALLARTGPVYNDRTPCEDRHGTCEASPTAAGFVPRATGFCLAGSGTTRIIPVAGPR